MVFRSLQVCLFSNDCFKVCYGHGFFYCFHFMSFLKDMFTEFGIAFCISISDLTLSTAQARKKKKLQVLLKSRVNDERPTGKKTQLVSGTTLEK